MFSESYVWDGLNNDDMAEVLSKIGPSIAVSKREEPEERKQPEYQPLDEGKRISAIKFFNVEKRFGFFDNNLFFHESDVIDGNKSFIKTGVKVAYEKGVDERSGRKKAVNIQLVKGDM